MTLMQILVEANKRGTRKFYQRKSAAANNYTFIAADSWGIEYYDELANNYTVGYDLQAFTAGFLAADDFEEIPPKVAAAHLEKLQAARLKCFARVCNGRN